MKVLVVSILLTVTLIMFNVTVVYSVNCLNMNYCTPCVDKNLKMCICVSRHIDCASRLLPTLINVNEYYTNLNTKGSHIPKLSVNSTTIEMADFRYSHISQILYLNLPTVRYVSLAHNNISTLENNTFRLCVKINMLDLSSNPLKIIKFSMFFPKSQMTFLGLDETDIYDMDFLKHVPDTFRLFALSLQRLRNVTTKDQVTNLRLASNEITSVRLYNTYFRCSCHPTGELYCYNFHDDLYDDTVPTVPTHSDCHYLTPHLKILRNVYEYNGSASDVFSDYLTDEEKKTVEPTTELEPEIFDEDVTDDDIAADRDIEDIDINKDDIIQKNEYVIIIFVLLVTLSAQLVVFIVIMIMFKRTALNNTKEDSITIRESELTNILSQHNNDDDGDVKTNKRNLSTISENGWVKRKRRTNRIQSYVFPKCFNYNESSHYGMKNTITDISQPTLITTSANIQIPTSSSSSSSSNNNNNDNNSGDGSCSNNSGSDNQKVTAETIISNIDTNIDDAETIYNDLISVTDNLIDISDTDDQKEIEIMERCIKQLAPLALYKHSSNVDVRSLMVTPPKSISSDSLPLPPPPTPPLSPPRTPPLPPTPPPLIHNLNKMKTKYMTMTRNSINTAIKQNEYSVPTNNTPTLNRRMMMKNNSYYVEPNLTTKMPPKMTSIPPSTIHKHVGKQIRGGLITRTPSPPPFPIGFVDNPPKLPPKIVGYSRKLKPTGNISTYNNVSVDLPISNTKQKPIISNHGNDTNKVDFKSFLMTSSKFRSKHATAMSNETNC